MSPRRVILGILTALTVAGCRVEAPDVRPTIETTPTAFVPVARPSAVATAGATSEVPRPEPTPLSFDFPVDAPSILLEWRPPPYPVPWSLRPEDHYFFARPIPSGEVNWPNARYRYGGTFFGEENTHTGVDLGAERGTPVLAAGAGEVVWTGYGLYKGYPDRTDPYGLAVAIRHDFGYGGEPLYTVYAHLGSISTWVGQRVATGDAIATVGDTGHATGAHLHFEVRLGANNFFSTRNPELWMVSPEGWGVLAGRIMNTGGRPMREARVQVTNLETGQKWDVWTYALGPVQSDSAFQENFVLGDLPAGPYEVRVWYFWRPMVASLLIHPGQTNFVVFQGMTGYLIEPTPTPLPGRFPPTS
ncbi:MAG TPA: peptidoglycan DD-metalloendopeptidase family protein [Anaerolineales bacterium]|nr:peptidoglycan DD-metalloendopeptidase family protein [Anaerolineales bacterium]